MHQPLFRERVLAAHGQRCAICRIRHRPLLHAAHIRSDSDGGEPIVTNGLALCSIHHGAYDANLLGIDSDARLHIRRDLLAEIDGPMLEHGFKDLDGIALTAPTQRAARPDRDLLAERYDAFLAAG